MLLTKVIWYHWMFCVLLQSLAKITAIDLFNLTPSHSKLKDLPLQSWCYQSLASVVSGTSYIVHKSRSAEESEEVKASPRGYRRRAGCVAGWSPFLINRKCLLKRRLDLTAVEATAGQTTETLDTAYLCLNPKWECSLWWKDCPCLTARLSGSGCLTWLAVPVCVLYTSCIMSRESTAGHLASVMFCTLGCPGRAI